MKNDWKIKLVKTVRPEYFFWAAAALSLLFVFTPPRLSPTSEAAAAISLAGGSENPFDFVPLEAKAAYVFDVQEQKPLYAKNALEVLPLASLTKIMTAVTALSLVPETTYITIAPDAIGAEGDSGFHVGERFLLRDLTKFMLLESSNDSAVAISGTIGSMLATTTAGSGENRAVFVLEMNRLARELGLAGTVFLNETGLDLHEQTAGGYGSAAEMARLFAHAIERYPRIFAETRFEELALESEAGSYAAVNTNTGTAKLPMLIASKTGYTDLAGGNLAIAFDAGFNRPVIIVVLGSTAEGRFTDVEKLVWATLAYLQNNQ